MTSGMYLAGFVGRTSNTGPPNATGYYATGTPIPEMAKWTVTPPVAELNATTARHMGFANPEPGVASATVTIELVCDVATENALSLPGATITDVRLFASGFNTDPTWQFPKLVVFEPVMSVEVEGQKKVTVRAKSAGPFRGPGQAAWTSTQITQILAGNYSSVFTGP